MNNNTKARKYQAKRDWKAARREAIKRVYNFFSLNDAGRKQEIRFQLTLMTKSKK